MTESAQRSRPWLGVCLAGLAVAIAVWVIRSEGDKNRQILREESDKLKREIQDASANPLGDAVGSPGQVLDEVRGIVLDDDSSEDRPPENKRASSSKSAEKSKRRDGGQLVSDLFKLGQDVANAADRAGQQILALDLEEQKRIGGELNKLIRKQHKVSPSLDQASRVRRLAQPLLERSKRDGIKYSFTVLESDQINAFSHVGGHIYINTGLLDFVGGDAELEFVLGHEIGHVELMHCSRKLTYSARASELGGELGSNLVQMAYHLVSVGYSETEEFEADEWSFRQLIEMGRSRGRALALPRHFMEKEQQEGRRKKRVESPTAAGAVVQEIDNHFRTHPAAAERLRRLERLKIKTDARRGGGESSR